MSKTYHPGDCVDVGKQTALRWIADGAARALQPQAVDAATLLGCGVLVRTSSPGNASAGARLSGHLPTVPIQTSDAFDLPFARTLLWDANYPIRPELIALGFSLLERWEVAAPLASYDTLACHIGDEVARNRTSLVIHDLRVPYYDPRLVFVQRCRAGRDLLDAWAEERASGDHDGLCLLRAIYRIKPLVCALPCTWSQAIPAIA